MYRGRGCSGVLCQPYVVAQVNSHRCKSARFKPKIAPVRAQKTPSMLALDHFDFYYGPLFGNQWPSVRLGLLTPHKYMAVLNNLSMDKEANRNILEGLGTVNLIERLTRGKKKKTDEAGIVGTDPVDAEAEGSSEEEPRPVDAPYDDRLSTGLDEFRPPTGDYSLGQLKGGMEVKPERQDIQITGLEFLNSRLETVRGFIAYPRELDVFGYGRDVFDHFPAPIRDKNGISSWWLLDGGSVLPVLALDLECGDKVLDMCSSPGGKSLMIIQTGLFGTLTCNDGKLSRLGQLRRGLAMYVPVESEMNERIVLKRKDASSLESWDEEDLYDKVLLDAPCSTDRLAANDDNGNMFSVGMTQERLNLPQLQTRMLINAFRSVKVGGSVVYSTCTMSPAQNESVVENAVSIAREHFGIEIVEHSLKRMENQLQNTGLYRFAARSSRGLLVVPFIRSNFGPMFVCKLNRTK